MNGIKIAPFTYHLDIIYINLMYLDGHLEIEWKTKQEKNQAQMKHYELK